MSLADYFYCRVIHWDVICGFLIRSLLSEQNFGLPDRAQAYQKILIITWIWSMLVIVQAYSGSLTAMLAKPKLQTPIRTLDELMNQEEIPWVIEKLSAFDTYGKTTESGTVMNKLYNGGTLMPSLNTPEKIKFGCYSAKLKGSGKFASICHRPEILYMYSNDFNENGKCNYYLLEENFLSSGEAMALHVRCTYVELQNTL